MLYNSIVLVPPLLVLGLAFYTHNVIKALAVGIITAGFIAANYSFTGTAAIVVNSFVMQCDISNFYIFGFLIFLGILTNLMSHSGGIQAYARAINGIIHTRKNAETTSLVLSMCLSIDDFFSSITVGSIMKSITDHFSIPRAKLAFLIDAMAAPLVLLIPFSSWIPMLTKQLQKGGISNLASDNPYIIADPFFTYLSIIPYMFYSFAIISGTWFIVRRRISFGLMHEQEQIAQSTGNLYGGKSPCKKTTSHIDAQQGSLMDFIVPISIFIAAILVILLYTGNYKLFGGSASLLTALLESNMFIALFYGSALATITTFALFIVQSKIRIQKIPHLLKEGSLLMTGSIVILVLAWTFGTILKDNLNTGAYLAGLVMNTIPLWLLPAVLFVTSAITSIATGSSWGTIAVITPLIVPMMISIMNVTPPVNLEQFVTILPLLGAIFSGAVAGDHVSPISSTTVMSSTSSGSYHTDHVNTQFQYAFPAMVSSCAGFIFIGISPFTHLYMNIGIALSIVVLFNFCMLWLFNRNK